LLLLVMVVVVLKLWVMVATGRGTGILRVSCPEVQDHGRQSLHTEPYSAYVQITYMALVLEMASLGSRARFL
jgi:hypothetical protein